MIELALLVVLLFGLMAVAGWVGRSARDVCAECGGRMDRFSELPDTEQSEILDFYERSNEQDCDPNRTQVCADCGLVGQDQAPKQLVKDVMPICGSCSSPGVGLLWDRWSSRVK
jgi:hypothetical protein